jgi:hypothetical protein
MLPATADPDVISHILGNSSVGSGWTRVGMQEGMRIMQQTDFNDQRTFTEDMMLTLGGSQATLPPTGRLCRKTQVLVSCSPINAFLALMDPTSPSWPSSPGAMRVVQPVDDHVDILGVCAPLPTDPASLCPWLESKKVLVGTLTRFWFLDDDGSYMITLSPTTNPEYPSAADRAPFKGLKEMPLQLDAVFTVSPHKNQDLFDDDLREALITCTVQVNTKDSTWRTVCERTRNEFLDSFVLQLLDVRHRILLSKYETWGEKFLLPRSVAVKPAGSMSPTSMGGGPHWKQIQRSTSSESYPGGVTTSQPVDYSKIKRDGIMETGQCHSHPQTRLISGKGMDHSRTMGSSHGVVISRTPEVNAEFHSLRNRIRTKQFELERLQEASCTTSSHPASAKGAATASKQISELRDDIKKLQTRLDRLLGSQSTGKNIHSNQSGRRKMNEYMESRETVSRAVPHIPSTPAARSVQSYQSPLLATPPKSPKSDKAPEAKKLAESIVPCPPHWLQRRWLALSSPQSSSDTATPPRSPGRTCNMTSRTSSS